jgi:glutamate-ammonia-ligase adenylyltransferase
MDPAANTNLERALLTLPAALQSVASRQLERWFSAADRPLIPDDMLPPLLRLLACSEYGANTFQKEWDWLFSQREALRSAPDIHALAAFAEHIGSGEHSLDEVKSEIRRYRHRFLLHVLWREYAAAAELAETLAALSALADYLLRGAAAYAGTVVQERFGRVYGEHGEPVSIVVLGMGKLGGSELNFSSDIDLIFLHPGGGDSDGRKSLSAHEYFTRVSRIMVALIEEPTADGFAFRIDTRLRPFGDSGPPVTSFSALESYLVRHGRGWERYAYVKARAVGPPPPPAVAKDLYDNLITPFVYRRYLDYGIFESLREMRALIGAEVERRELADNIKLGPGGIREIEFMVQSLQLVRGGSRPDLQGRELQTILPRLVGQHGINADDVAALQSAYVFLRRLENFIQAIRDQQTHELPVDALDQARLAAAMQFPDWSALRRTLDAHRSLVATQFGKMVFREQGEVAGAAPRRRFAELWNTTMTRADWAEALRTEGFAEAEAIATALDEFRDAAAHADRISSQRLRQFIPNLLLKLKAMDAPLVALQRMLTVAERVMRRSAYLALLNENTAAMEKLVDLCAQSAYVAREIARYPVLLDELLDPGIYTGHITRAGLQADLVAQIGAVNADDSEAQMELLAKFQRANQFRIALADFNGSLRIMRVSDCLTYLAEVVLGRALQVAWRDLTAVHGAPGNAGLGIIAYGKLGGLELSYGSDLDLVFLHDSPGAGHLTDGRKPLDHTMFYTRLVQRLVHFLTTQTGSGMLYEVDMRLRPDGKSGLLVSSVEAFGRYQDANAWTWEHQALLRARPVAGSDSIAREFERIRCATLTADQHHGILRNDVISMRRRMREQLDRSDAQIFDLKQGKGGIGDIEFLVQYLVLANAATHPSVVHYSDNIRQLDALAATGCLDADTASQLQSTYRDYRLHVHRLLLDDRVAEVAHNEFESQRRFVSEVWAKQLGD